MKTISKVNKRNTETKKKKSFFFFFFLPYMKPKIKKKKEEEEEVSTLIQPEPECKQGKRAKTTIHHHETNITPNNQCRAFPCASESETQPAPPNYITGNNSNKKQKESRSCNACTCKETFVQGRR
jgi:hypothetical protein